MAYPCLGARSRPSTSPPSRVGGVGAVLGPVSGRPLLWLWRFDPRRPQQIFAWTSLYARSCHRHTRWGGPHGRGGEGIGPADAPPQLCPAQPTNRHTQLQQADRAGQCWPPDHICCSPRLLDAPVWAPRCGNSGSNVLGRRERGWEPKEVEVVVLVPAVLRLPGCSSGVPFFAFFTAWRCSQRLQSSPVPRLSPPVHHGSSGPAAGSGGGGG